MNFCFPNSKVSMVEMQMNTDTQVPPGLLVAFVICSSLLIAVNMIALMISTCILPHIQAISSLYDNVHDINIVEESPNDRLHW